jgi:[acyl-carrier-protein] S-malonyltransferase
MGRELAETSQSAREVFERVSEALAFDVAGLCFDAEEEELRKTENTQIALYAVSMAAAAALGFPGAIVMAGHSIGEYAALAAAQKMDIETGAKLVRRRGDLMGRVGALRDGTMAAVLGLDDEVIVEACRKISRGGGVVVPANFNCPGQCVISGDRAAVETACETLKELGAKRCLPLKVSGAFHSPLMRDAATAMAEALDAVTFEEGQSPVISNVTAEVGQNWAELLEQQLESPVRWTESVRKMAAIGANTFIECGSGEVLSGLIKRIVPEANCISVGDAAGVESAKEVLAACTH